MPYNRQTIILLQMPVIKNSNNLWRRKNVPVFKRLKSALRKSSETLENRPEERLYRKTLEASRNPQLYLRFEVADTLDGRFDMLCLHVGLVMRRLKAASEAQSAAFSQNLFDIFFGDMDLTLREMGVGDLGVAKRVRQMSEAYMGRLTAYSHFLDAGDTEGLAEALARNIGRDEKVSDKDRQCAVFVEKAAKKLEAVPIEALLSAEADIAAVFQLDKE
ncbi:MAG: ubiquinol-cytochrome C chaperone family protein [Candidatus Puniceispirillaceae bacterium]